MPTFLQDLRIALRSVRTTPLFAAACVSCIALGIAANVFVWSPFNAMVMRPLPYREADRVMRLSMWRMNEQRRSAVAFSYPDYDDLSRAANQRRDVFDGISAWYTRAWNLSGMHEPERVNGARVGADLFPLLSLRPALGRFFLPEEELAGKVLVVSHALWRRRFGGDSAIVGRMVRVNDEPYTVIGVMQEGIRFPEQEDLWLPLELGTARTGRDWRYLQVTARLTDGVSVARANAWLGDFMASTAERYPSTNRGFTAWVQPLQEEVAGEMRRIFLVMIGAVTFVLLIACANVANLLLARGSARQREIALRSALGATRTRIVRQLLTESLVLATAGGALGLLIGSWSIELFTATNAPSTIPFWMKFDVDRTVLLVSAGLTIMTGVVFGLAPALRLSATSLGEALKAAGGRSVIAGGRAGRLRSSLVVMQLTLSLVLLVGASLMMRSFLATQQADLGVRPHGVLSADLAMAGAAYDSAATRVSTLAAMERELRAIPSVTAVGFTTVLPIKRCCTTISYFPEGKYYPQSDGPVALRYAISPGFVEAAGMTLVEGRGVLPTDDMRAEPVALVDEVLARREWPTTTAIGQRFKTRPGDSVWTTVVGVVRHVVPRKIVEDRLTTEIFLALAQQPDRALTIAVRSDRNPSSVVHQVAAAVRRVDRELPLAEVEPMTRSIWNRMFEPRVYGIMFAAFGLAALILAGIGLYGVVSYTVARRIQEMGIRIALGAGQQAIVRLVVADCARLIAAGVALGLPAAFVLARLLRGTLYHVETSDVTTFVGIPLFLVIVSIVAAWAPARRASRVDPAVALRAD
ncbi:MAG: hypothetical protein MNPFHGCM_02483 [Gemmatimonadaceae bacterium]|nr:hypothetical protein [Gemmatimonadaceae bacterium]